MRLYTRTGFFHVFYHDAIAKTRLTRLASSSCLYLRRRTTRKTTRNSVKREDQTHLTDLRHI